MSIICEYFKLEEKKCKDNSNDRNPSQRFSKKNFIGKCTHVKCAEPVVSCYGMIDLCQISDAGVKD